MLARVVGEVVGKPLLSGNRIEPLLNGDETYPAMLEAIRNAKQTVSFLTYIFDRDEIGLEFAKAFGEATRRGVEVRVLIDAAGQGIPCQRFFGRYAARKSDMPDFFRRLPCGE